MDAGSKHTPKPRQEITRQRTPRARKSIHARRRTWCGFLFAGISLWILNILADDCPEIVDWFAGDLFTLAAVSFLRGFMPVIFSIGFILLASLLYVLLLCSIEQELTDDGDEHQNEPDAPQSFMLACNHAIPFFPRYISLTEHSPPLPSLSTL